MRLNPNDNQGVRYLLAACLLVPGEDERLGELLDRYRGGPSALWPYVRALWTYRKEGDTAKARKQLKAALTPVQKAPSPFDEIAGRTRVPPPR